MSIKYKAPFPYFGGKSRIAELVWQYLGDVPNFVEPFAGSASVLLARPHEPKHETINDADGFISNFWRALQAKPRLVAKHADWPVNENDLHARHAWLVGKKESMQAKLEGNPAWFDAKVAGWWVWGMSCWIGGEFCSGKGPWQVVDGQLVHLGNAGRGVRRRLVHLGNAGRGVRRQLVGLGNAGMGVNRRRVHLGDAGRGEAGAGEQGLLAWMNALADRLRRVRVCCGDWSRVCGPTPTIGMGKPTGVFLDPPYSDCGRDTEIYRVDSTSISADCLRWAMEHGDDKRYRIVFCGYEGEHEFPKSWRCIPWKAHGGYAMESQSGPGRENRHRERLWISPHCLEPAETRLERRDPSRAPPSDPGRGTEVVSARSRSEGTSGGFDPPMAG